MIKVLGDRCLVELSLKTKETDSGIQLVSDEEHEQVKGVVLAVGNKGPVAVGDRVLMEQFAGYIVDDVEWDGVPVIVDYADILAVVS